MMEVTPHLKSVLKNYQHSATKSLQGPGAPKRESSLSCSSASPVDDQEDELFASAPYTPVVQQLPPPILSTADTSCSERTETTLEGETISCFLVGGEKRLCLPQVLNSVLRDFSLPQINQECDQLQIYCSRCTPEQLNVLKNCGILPSGAASSGLITKTDAERLCSALLHHHHHAANKPPKAKPTTLISNNNATSFPIYHKCFGKCTATCHPELYTAKESRCIECAECGRTFTPQQFVCHVHKHYAENRTVHWGFDSANWRTYIRVPDEAKEKEKWCEYLDEMYGRYEGKIPFPPPPPPPIHHTIMKRKQVLASDLIREHDLPLKKQKILDEYITPTGYNLYASLDAMYLNQYIQDFQVVNRHLSAFKPVNKEKMYNHLIYGRYGDPPVLQNPERVVLMSESERFERSFQPNVALAPPTPKKHRYGKFKYEPTQVEIKQEEVIVKQEPEEEPMVSVLVEPPTPVIPAAKYNSEIELSTDTEDSASETSDKRQTLEDLVRDVEADLKEKILQTFAALLADKERLVDEVRAKDGRIEELEARIEQLEGQSLCNGREEGDSEEKCSSIIVTPNHSDLEGQKSVITTLEPAEPKAIINNTAAAPE